MHGKQWPELLLHLGESIAPAQEVACKCNLPKWHLIKNTPTYNIKIGYEGKQRCLRPPYKGLLSLFAEGFASMPRKPWGHCWNLPGGCEWSDDSSHAYTLKGWHFGLENHIDFLWTPHQNEQVQGWKVPSSRAEAAFILRSENLQNFLERFILPGQNVKSLGLIALNLIMVKFPTRIKHCSFNESLFLLNPV